jgi:cytidine deaminase
MTIDWDALHVAAVEAASRAYCPYSKFPVGAAGLTASGRTVVGCNVENASFGLGLCAECGMISQLQVTGGGTLVAVATRLADGRPVMPCGRCRQLLWEHRDREAGCLLDGDGEPKPLEEILPGAFGPEDLAF